MSEYFVNHVELPWHTHTHSEVTWIWLAMTGHHQYRLRTIFGVSTCLRSFLTTFLYNTALNSHFGMRFLPISSTKNHQSSASRRQPSTKTFFWKAWQHFRRKSSWKPHPHAWGLLALDKMLGILPAPVIVSNVIPSTASCQAFASLISFTFATQSITQTPEIKHSVWMVLTFVCNLILRVFVDLHDDVKNTPCIDSHNTNKPRCCCSSSSTTLHSCGGFCLWTSLTKDHHGDCVMHNKLSPFTSKLFFREDNETRALMARALGEWLVHSKSSLHPSTHCFHPNFLQSSWSALEQINPDYSMEDKLIRASDLHWWEFKGWNEMTSNIFSRFAILQSFIQRMFAHIFIHPQHRLPLRPTYSQNHVSIAAVWSKEVIRSSQLSLTMCHRRLLVVRSYLMIQVRAACDQVPHSQSFPSRVLCK